MATDPLAVGVEVSIRARAMYDAAGRKIAFTGIVTALNAYTFDATVSFNGITLNVSGIPYELGAPPEVATSDAGTVEGEDS